MLGKCLLPFVHKLSSCSNLHKDLKTKTQAFLMVPGLYIGLKVGSLLWESKVPSALNVFSTNRSVSVQYHLLLWGMRVSEE
jgi:hypothetical protein